ncbi:MAG: 3-deoxy-7-phosphoheptulonate synthase, partial [Lachnospiraceae bacterium]
EDLECLIQMYDKMDLLHPAAIIDSNHANSNKQYEQQVRIIKEVMHNRQIAPNIHQMVKGVMIESYLEPGSQKVGEHVYGKSITDSCLGWKESEELIYHIADMNQ